MLSCALVRYARVTGYRMAPAMTTNGRLPRNSSSSMGQALVAALLRSRRGMVLTSFAGSIVVLAALLVLVEGQRSPGVGGRSIAPLAASAASVPLEAITEPPVGLDGDRWRRIVIHHSRSRHGNAAQLARSHQSMGLAGLGYHFVIGNGRGMADGELHVA